MPKDSFSPAAKKHALIKPGQQLWVLAPPAPQREPFRPADPEEPPTVAQLMEWLSGPIKGDEAAYELRQEILRTEEPLATVAGEAGPESEFRHLMDANFRAHERIAEENTTALATAAWEHMRLLDEYLRRRSLLNRFGNLALRQPTARLQPYSGSQLLRLITQAPGLRRH